MGTLLHLWRKNPDENQTGHGGEKSHLKLNKNNRLALEQVANPKKLQADLQGISAYVEVLFILTTTLI